MVWSCNSTSIQSSCPHQSIRQLYMSYFISFSIVTLVLVLIFLSSILVTFHVRIIGWPRITIGLITAPVVLAIILLCAAQSIGTSQVCDGILEYICNIFISLTFMAITLDGENTIRKLYLYFDFHLAAVITLLHPHTHSHCKRKSRRRRKGRREIGMENDPQEGEKTDSESTSLMVDLNKVLGFGSLGAIVFEGLYQGRAVAVKCFPKNPVTLAAASHEKSILQQSDDHPNVITCYNYRTSHPTLIQIVLDLCPASLADIIENLPYGKGSDSRREEWRAIAQGFDAKKAMKQIASGLEHLHGLGLVHRDIRPRNILISPSSLRGKHKMLISNFGLCTNLDEDQSSFSPTTNGAMAAGTAGWQAPEMLLGDDKLDELSVGDDSISSQGNQASTINGSSSGAMRPRLTKSVDIFALGCLFHYIFMEGKHPFGDRDHREANIVKDKKDLSLLHSKEEEAYDLITRMIRPQPSQRPDIETCLLHPFFWDAAKRLGFLRKASDRFEIMCKGPPMDKGLERLERDAESIVGSDWHQTLDPSSDQILLRDLRRSRTYDGRSVRDLLRVLRNKTNHYEKLSYDVKLQLGSMPRGFLGYFTRRYPKLLIYVHEVVLDTGLHHETMFKSYFELSES